MLEVGPQIGPAGIALLVGEVIVELLLEELVAGCVGVYACTWVACETGREYPICLGALLWILTVPVPDAAEGAAFLIDSRLEAILQQLAQESDCTEAAAYDQAFDFPDVLCFADGAHVMYVGCKIEVQIQCRPI